MPTAITVFFFWGGVCALFAVTRYRPGATVTVSFRDGGCAMLVAIMNEYHESDKQRQHLSIR